MTPVILEGVAVGEDECDVECKDALHRVDLTRRAEVFAVGNCSDCKQSFEVLHDVPMSYEYGGDGKVRHDHHCLPVAGLLNEILDKRRLPYLSISERFPHVPSARKLDRFV